MDPQWNGCSHSHLVNPWGAARHFHNGPHGESDVFTSLRTHAGIYPLAMTTLEVRMTTVLAGDTGSCGAGQPLRRVGWAECPWALPDRLLPQVRVQVNLLPFLLILRADHGHCRSKEI